MRELLRILRPERDRLVMVPRDVSRPVTFEDPTITTPEARQAAYWQADHVRLYGCDFEDRLRAAGFEVELVRPSLTMSASDVRRFGLAADPDVYRKYGSPPRTGSTSLADRTSSLPGSGAQRCAPCRRTVRADRAAAPSATDVRPSSIMPHGDPPEAPNAAVRAVQVASARISGQRGAHGHLGAPT